MEPLEMTTTAILDTEQAYDVLVNAGPEALAVYFVLEVLKDRQGITIEALARHCNMNPQVVERACYRLGLVQLGITQ